MNVQTLAGTKQNTILLLGIKVIMADTIEQVEKSISLAKIEIQELLKLESNRGSSYVWRTDEVRRVAPKYGGSAKRFRPSMYAENVRQRTLKPLEEKLRTLRGRQTIDEDVTRFQEPKMSLQRAVVSIFHGSCPRLYRTPDMNQDDIAQYEAELKLWMVSITATWRNFSSTSHQEDCTCCITFKTLATNWQDMLERALSAEEYHLKRVAANDIIEWAKTISSESNKDALQSLHAVAESILKRQEDARLSDVTTDSSNMSDEKDGRISVMGETQWKAERENHKFEEDSDEELTERPVKRLRTRASTTRSLSKVYELSRIMDEVTYAIPEIGKTASVSIRNLSPVERHVLCTYFRLFFEQLLKVNSATHAIALMSDKEKIRLFVKNAKEHDKRKYVVCDTIWKASDHNSQHDHARDCCSS